MWIFKPGILISALSVVVLASSTETASISPKDSHHWQKLDKVCESGRKTYGANEFVEKGQVCRWTMVPYWPEDRAAWDAARAAERRTEK